MIRYLLFIIFFYPSFLVSGVLDHISFIDDSTFIVKLNDDVSYSSEISDSKKSINYLFPNTQLGKNIKNLNVNNEYIDDIYISKQNDTVKLNIKLNDKLGYMSMFLPYSQSILIRVFDWEYVTAERDKVISAVLAFENRLYEQTLSISENIEDKVVISSIKGLSYLAIDSVEKAYKYLYKSFSNNSNIPDVYAGLSQIYNSVNDTISAKKLEKLFVYKLFEKDTILEYPKLIFSTKDFNVRKISGNEIIENTPDENEAETELEEKSENDRFKKIFSNQDSTKEKSIPDTFGNSLFEYLLIVIAVVLSAIFILYLFWRINKKKQFQKENKPSIKDNFKKELDQEIIKKKTESNNEYKNPPKTASKQTIDKIYGKIDTVDKKNVPDDTPTNINKDLSPQKKNIPNLNVDKKIAALDNLSNSKKDITDSLNKFEQLKRNKSLNKLKSKLSDKFNV